MIWLVSLWKLERELLLVDSSRGLQQLPSLVSQSGAHLSACLKQQAPRQAIIHAVSLGLKPLISPLWRLFYSSCVRKAFVLDDICKLNDSFLPSWFSTLPGGAKLSHLTLRTEASLINTEIF